MTRRRELPRVMGLRDAAEHGITGSAIKHGVAELGWQRLARGVVLTASGPPTREDWILAGLVLAGPDAALSGWDAARLRGIGQRTPPTPRALVLTRSAKQRSAPGVLVRRTSRSFRTSLLPGEHPTLGHVPYVHVARAVADTALMYRSLPPVRALVTSAIQRGLCRPADLIAEFESGPRAHSRWLGRALEDVRINAHSIAEAEAADALRVARVPAFELNVDVVTASGRLVGIADVLWRRLRAIGEIDSREFHFDEQSWLRTTRRHNALTSHGLAVAHWPPSEIRRDPPGWAFGVRDWLRRRARELEISWDPGSGALPCPPAGPAPFIVE